MMQRPADRTWLLLVLALAASATLAGCAKKTPVNDTTANTPEPTTDQKPPGGDESANKDNMADGSDADRMLKDVFFEYDDHTLSEEARSVLSGDATYLKAGETGQVTIEGHCDERGTVEYNLALGQRRADAARSYLMDLGVASARLATVSYGEERPFEFGHDEHAWSQNRRAHFRVNVP